MPLVTCARLFLSRLPKICPWRATVVQRKGSSASRRASGVSLQNSRRRASGSATPPSFLFRSESSAPRKTSCQRRPSVVTSTTLRVVGRGLASSDLAGTTKACSTISRDEYRRACGMGAFRPLSDDRWWRRARHVCAGCPLGGTL